jgi:hypothetical protein
MADRTWHGMHPVDKDISDDALDRAAFGRPPRVEPVNGPQPAHPSDPQDPGAQDPG